jgi:hypothetical protein
MHYAMWVLKRNPPFKTKIVEEEAGCAMIRDTLRDAGEES